MNKIVNSFLFGILGVFVVFLISDIVWRSKLLTILILAILFSLVLTIYKEGDDTP